MMKAIATHSLTRCLLALAARLEKIIADRGVASRNKARDIIRAGRVKVDNRVVLSPDRRFDEALEGIAIDGNELPPVPLLIAFHKPKGVHCTMGDPQGRPSLKEAVPEVWARMGLHPVSARVCALRSPASAC
jgi:16S rRNA U516 pseudouridylate synthase RsuA-like enzyme